MLLCGNATDCPHLNASQWTLTNFLQHYFKSPELLVQSGGGIGETRLVPTLEQVVRERESNPPSSVQSELEDALWSTNPWVVCGAAGNCSGSIPKAQWLADRGGTCKTVIVDFLRANPNQLAVELDICNLNSDMDALCKHILNSKRGVAAANCLALGSDACLERTFFYSPSTFVSSNQEVKNDSTIMSCSTINGRGVSSASNPVTPK